MFKYILLQILYNILDFIDFIDYKIIRKGHLTDNVKTIEEIDINDNILVETDTGYEPISKLLATKPYNIYYIRLKNGYEIECADNHILFLDDMTSKYAKDIQCGDIIKTDIGPSCVVTTYCSCIKMSMYDVSVNDNNHRLYTNGILSHNSTTTAIFCLWSILFNTDKKGLILSKSGPAGIDLLSKIKDMFLYLPYHLKCGIMKWNQHEISFDSNSSISTEAFSPTAGLGQTINFLILDEFAWCPPNDVDLFYTNVIPTVTTQSNATVCIMSTQNGFNLFYKLWQNAITKKSIYAPFKVDWWQVPQFNSETHQWEKRTNAWKEKMVGILGSEEDFYYQYGTEFSASDKCLASRQLLGTLHSKEILFEQLSSEQAEIVNFYKQEYLYIKPGYDIRDFGKNYFVILVDLAEGGGGDSTVFNILEMTGEEEFEQVAYWRSNEVEIEKASLAFWTMYGNMFDQNKTIISIEWNTYGSLFIYMIQMLNEPTYKPEYSFRYKMSKNEDIDMSSIVHYKKGSQEEEVSIGKVSSKQIPGIRFNSSNKKAACALLKIYLEKEQIKITDIYTISELENFEDKTGSGTYKASYGHDDVIMTFCQIPMMVHTFKFKDFLEDFKSDKESPMSNQNDAFDASDFYGAPQMLY